MNLDELKKRLKKLLSDFEGAGATVQNNVQNTVQNVQRSATPYIQSAQQNIQQTMQPIQRAMQQPKLQFKPMQVDLNKQFNSIPQVQQLNTIGNFMKTPQMQQVTRTITTNPVVRQIADKPLMTVPGLPMVKLPGSPTVGQYAKGQVIDNLKRVVNPQANPIDRILSGAQAGFNITNPVKSLVFNTATGAVAGGLKSFRLKQNPTSNIASSISDPLQSGIGSTGLGLSGTPALALDMLAGNPKSIVNAAQKGKILVKGLKGYSPRAFNIHPDDQTIMKDFVNAVQTGKGKSNLGQLGRDAQAIAEHYINKNARTMSNEKLAQAFDALLASAAKSRGEDVLQTQFPRMGLVSKPPVTSPNALEGTSKVQMDEDVLMKGYKEISRLSDEPKKTVKDYANEVYTQWVDRFHPVNRVAKQAESIVNKQGAMIRPEYNPIYTIRKFLGAGGKADYQYKTQIEPIIKEIDSLKIDKKDLDLYLKSRREVGFGSIGREVYGSDPVVAQQRVQAIESKYGDSIKAIADKLYAVENSRYKELVDAGFISKEQAQLIQQQNPDYVPFKRNLDDQLDEYLGLPTKKLQQATNPVMKLKGSDKTIYSPLESIIADNIRLTSAIEKNKVAKSIVGLKNIVSSLPFTKVDKSSNSTIAVWENGVKNYYDVGSDIADTVKGLNEEQASILVKVLSMPASLLRQGATGRNLDFMVPNIIRDQQDAMINSKYGYNPLDFIRGFAHVVKNDEIYQQWQKSGASMSFGSLSGRKSIQQMFDEKKSKRTLFNWITNTLDTIGKYSEQPTRVGLFAKALKKTGNESLAVMESRDATLDFSRMGSKMKTLNAIIPFLNVGVQGFDKLIRSAKDNPGKFALNMALYGVTPSVATTLYNTTQYPNEYKEIPQFVKDSNFVIVTGRNEKGTVDYVTIPKGNVIQYTANPIENFISYTADTNQQTLGEMALQFFSSGLPVIGDGSSVGEIGLRTIGGNLPQAVKPATEVFLNKSFFKYDKNKDEAKSIVPNYLLNKAPADQKYDWTPRSYQAIGSILNVSPLKVQNVLEGYFAGYTKIPNNIIETLFSISEGGSIDKNKIPILRRLMQETYPTKNQTSTPKPVPASSIIGQASASEVTPIDKLLRRTPADIAKREQAKQAAQQEQKIADLKEQDKTARENVKYNGKSIMQDATIWYKKDTGEVGKISLAEDKTSTTHGIDQFSGGDSKFKKAREIYGISDLSNSQKKQAYNTLGINENDVEYDYKANKSTDAKVKYTLAQKLDHNTLLERMLTGRKESISGELFASNAVLDALVQAGELSKYEAKYLKTVKFDKDSNQITNTISGSSGGRKGKGKSLPSPTIRVKQMSTPTIKLTGSKMQFALKPRKVQSIKLKKLTSPQLEKITVAKPLSLQSKKLRFKGLRAPSVV